MSNFEKFKQEDILGEKVGMIALDENNVYNGWGGVSPSLKNPEKIFDVYLQKDTCNNFFIVMNGIVKFLNKKDCEKIVVHSSFLNIEIQKTEEMLIKATSFSKYCILIKGFLETDYDEIKKFFKYNFIEGDSWGNLEILYDRIIFKTTNENGAYIFYENGNFEYFGMKDEYEKTMELFEIKEI